MNPVFVIANIAALLFVVVLLFSLSNRYRLIFLSAAFLPVIVTIIIGFFAFDAASWGATEYIMLLLRGVFIFSVITGTLACYLVTKISNKR